MSKISKDRNHRLLLDLVALPGNDVCADCKAHAPRWSSWNLGIFICVQCASIHRKIGTHITKVKSITLDTWTKEQVDSVKQMGNVNSNAIYNPNVRRNPPPVNMEESERDSEMEKFIRGKYEFKKFMDREAVGGSATHRGAAERTSQDTDVGSSRITVTSELRYNEGARVSRSKTAPLPATWNPSEAFAESFAPEPTKKPVFGSTLQYRPSTTITSSATLPRSGNTNPFPTATTNARQAPPAAPPLPSHSSNPVWDDLISLQSTTPQSPQPPLQYASPSFPTTSTFQPSRSVSLGSVAFGTNQHQQQQSSTNPFPMSLSQNAFQSAGMSPFTGLQQQTQMPPVMMSPTGAPQMNSPFASPAISTTQQFQPTPPPFGSSGMSQFQPTTSPPPFQSQIQQQQSMFSQLTNPFPQQNTQQNPYTTTPSPFQPTSSPFQPSSSPFQQTTHSYDQQQQQYQQQLQQMQQQQAQQQQQSFSGGMYQAQPGQPAQPQQMTSMFAQSMMPARQAGPGFGGAPPPNNNNPFGQWMG